MPLSSVTDSESWTFREIFQQPTLWPTTLERVKSASARLDFGRLLSGRVLLTGAGSSAYAAAAVAAARPGSLAVPTTDLLIDMERHLAGVDAVISLARSGQSPESAAVVELVRRLRPRIFQLAITCNPESPLTQSPLDGIILLDPRANDQSLVMTSSFSNLVLAGLALFQPMDSAVTASAPAAEKLLPIIDRDCRAMAGLARDRIAVLASSPLAGWALEARLKAMEMTAGAFPVMAETYLGLRHGPLSFLRPDTLLICLLSSDPRRRLYEQDLLHQLRAKQAGHLVGVGDPADAGDLFDTIIPAIAPNLPDALRTPFEIIIPQLFGYHLSLAKGLNPDNPSPGGMINRVVKGVVIHPAGA
jgi:tagatose-6-phosphate ketose/aldose isomerase